MKKCMLGFGNFVAKNDPAAVSGDAARTFPCAANLDARRFRSL
jgi:hypothetical protein